MALSKQQEGDLFKVSVETAKDIKWIREQLQGCDETQKEQCITDKNFLNANGWTVTTN